MANLVGQQLGNYILEKLLGEGGFAQVYLGEHIDLGYKRAIKVLYTITLTEQERESFRTEAQMHARLNHPYIIPILDFDARERLPYIVLEYAPNGSLRDLHPKETCVRLPTVIEYIKQIAPALQYMHEQKLIHRDIKPANMLIGPNNTILLSDIGIAIAAHSERSQQTQNPTGTPYYMAPEQFRGKAERASDQYSLAVVVYEWLCGMLPFTEGDPLQLRYQHEYTRPPSLREKIPIIPVDVEKAIMKALAKKPEERFTSVQTFVDELEKADTTKPVQPTIQRKSPDSNPHIATLREINALTTKREAAIDIHALYREGFDARTRGDLEQAASLWQQVLDKDKNYGNGILATQMQKLCEEIHQQQIRALRQQAKQAQRARNWQQAATSWKDLQKLDPESKQARKCWESCLLDQATEVRKKGEWTQEITILTDLGNFAAPKMQETIKSKLEVSRNNRKHQWMYEQSAKFVQDSNKEAARYQLKEMWKLAPKYGDPEGVGKRVGLYPPSGVFGTSRVPIKGIASLSSMILIILSIIILFNALTTHSYFLLTAGLVAAGLAGLIVELAFTSKETKLVAAITMVGATGGIAVAVGAIDTIGPIREVTTVITVVTATAVGAAVVGAAEKLLSGEGVRTAVAAATRAAEIGATLAAGILTVFLVVGAAILREASLTGVEGAGAGIAGIGIAAVVAATIDIIRPSKK